MSVRTALRSGDVSPTLPVPKSIPRPEYAWKPTAREGSEPWVQTPEVIEKMRVAGRIAAAALAQAGKAVAPGVTTDHLDRVAHEYMVDHGAYPSTLGYKGFPKSCCTSLNEIICHGIPDSTVIADGDIVNIDVTAYIDGVHGDCNATFLAGDVSEEHRLLVERTHEATMRAIKAVKPGRQLSVVGRVIESYANRFGYNVVRDFTGHGIGTTFHNGLVVLHYDQPSVETVLEPGMTFTIEPMINLGALDYEIWDDGWTVATKDRRWTAQFEHTLVVTEDGADILTLPPWVSGALLVAGTTSDAGKSMVVAGLCRLLARTGVRVAPFKAQNMSNNSAVTADGGEIGRAQAVQARAAGLAPSVRFNPILLKPGSDRTSQLVVRGAVAGTLRAADYLSQRERLAGVVAEELAGLRAEFDVVICEGAGSPAEINLRSTDLANMGLARAADIPVIVVGDIDRGGLLAHLFGTVAVLEPADQALIAGFVVNKFRGDRTLLEPGLDQLLTLTGRPTYGVLPYVDGLWLDTEDSLSVVANRVVGLPTAPRGSQGLEVAAIRLPRISNSTDIEALACEPGVRVHWVTDAADAAAADVIVIPGTKATVADLAWLRTRGLDDAITAHAAAGRTVLGICGGFQMLCRRIVDEVESGRGSVEGLALLDADIEFATDKILQHWESPLSGYEIHHGRVTRSAEAEWHGVGLVRGSVFGTHWHGLLDNNELRRGWLTAAADAAHVDGFVVADDVDVPGRRDAQLDLMADLLTAHLDLDAVSALLTGGAPSRPVVASALAGNLVR